MKYYYADPDNQPIGPFDVQELLDLGRSGVIGPGMYIIGEGQQEWRRFDEVFPSVVAPRSAALAAGEAPVSVKVIGVINVVLGALGLLGGLVIVAGLVFLYAFAPAAGLKTILPVAFALVDLVKNALYVATGAGLLARREWARRLAVVFGMCNIFYILVHAAAGPWILREQLPGSGLTLMTFVIGGLVVAALHLIYPVVMVLLLRRDCVKASMAGGAVRQ